MFDTVSLVGQLYTGLFGISGLICVLAVFRARKVDNPDVRRGLVWLLATSGGWALSKATFFVLPHPLDEAMYMIGLAIGFGTVWAWLYFCSAYTGRNYHHNTTLRRLSAGVFLGVVSIKITNPIHGAYFTATETTTPFPHLAIQHNVLHWTATGLSYVLASIGLFMIFQRFAESDFDTRPLGVLSILIMIPVVADIGAQFTSQIIDVIYAPIGVAAFAIGVLFVFERRFLAVQRTAVDDERSIYLDEQGRIRDASTAVVKTFPELRDATGQFLSEVLPKITDTIEDEQSILEHEVGGETRYFFVSTSTVTLGEAGARIVQLSDVTQTERQRRQLIERERQLDEKNELYRAIIDASFAFVFRLDEEGRFTFVSPSVEEFLGYSPSELDGKEISVTHPDEETTQRAFENLEPVLNGEPNRVPDFPLETKAGTTVYADIRAVPIYEVTVPPEERTPDDIVGVQLMVRDATERREREGLISVINRVLRHNLRNKMTVISSYAGMLQENLDDEQADRATHIKDTAERLLDLSESAQQIEENREAEPELEAVDIVPIVERAVSQLRLRYPDATIDVDTPDTAMAQSHERLETAVWEIVDNAAKHGGDPASVDVDVTIADRQVRINVSDNGPGLPSIEREVLQSSTETQLVHAEGLGLWLVYWIVTSLNGEVEATDSPGGTTVTVRLPKA